MWHRRRVPVAGGPGAGRDDVERHRAPRSGRRRAVQLARRRGGRQCSWPTAGSSIIDLSAAADQPFVKDGLRLRLQRRALQLPRAAGASSRAAACAFRTSSRHRGGAGGLAALGSGQPAPAPGHVRLRASSTSDAASLALARDQFGIKPLFFTPPTATACAFASELKAIVAARRARARRSTRPAWWPRSLYYWIPERRLRVEGRRKLPPGHLGRVPPGRHRSSVHLLGIADDGRPGAACRTAAPTCARPRGLRRAPTSWPTCPWRRSSAAASTPAWSPCWRSGSNPRSTPTPSRFRAEDQRLEAMPDDLRYARIVARQLGIDLHEIEISPDVVDMLPRMVDHARRADRRPRGDQHPAHLRRRSRSRGQGAALGHGRRRALRRLPQAPRLPPGGALPAGSRLPCATGSSARRRPAAGRGRRAWAAPVALGQALRLVRRPRRGGGVPPQLHAATPATRSRTCWLPTLSGRSTGWSPSTPRSMTTRRFDDPVNRMCLTDVRMFMPGLNLAYTDRASMAASCEVRVPFVDLEVVRAAFALPGGDKIRGPQREGRPEEVGRGWLPKEIIDRPKGRSACRCARGSAATCGTWSTTCSRRRAGAVRLPAAGAVAER